MRASTKRKAVSYSVPPLRLRKLGRTLVDLTKVQDDDDMGLDALEEEESKLDLFNMRMSGRQNIIGVLNANVHLGRQSEEEDEQPWLESEENQNWPVRWPTSARVPGPKSKPSDWELQKERLDWEKMQARIAWEKKQAAAGGGVEGNGVARSSSTLSSKFLEQGGDDRFAMDGDDLDTGYEMFEDTGRKKSRSSLEVSRTSVEKVSLLERTRVSQSVAAEERKARHLKILLEKACSVVNQHGLPEDQEQSLADALKEVHYSMKEFYQRFLRIELSGDVLVPVTSLLPKSIAATFSDEKQYIDTFGPLLLEESLFAVRTELNECQGLNRKSKQGLEVVCWRVCDNDNISLDSLDDGRQLTTAERHDDISSMTGRLVEMHICQPHKERHSELPDAERLINAGKPGHPKGCAPERSCWLVREDLVLVFALPPGRSYNNTQNMSISAIMRTPHILAVVGSSPTDTAPPTLIVRSSDLLNACMLRDWGTKPFGHWFVVPLASVATPAREWAALQAIRNNRLVPLTPYILTGSQVVSAHTLGSLKNHMKKKIETFEAIWKAKEENHQEDIEVWKHCTAIIASLARDVEVLASFRIDSSVLIKTDIVTFIKTDLGRSQMLKSYRDISGLGVCQDLLNSSKQLLDDWKARIKANENERVKQLKGKPITIRGYPSTSAVLQDDLDILPFNVSMELWATMTLTYNQSQLSAIARVCNNISAIQYMHIQLLQGPPGTGKTTTIMGMMSVLLLPSPALSSISGSKPRLLLCTPSNIAIDELLTRLLLPKAILDNNGNARKIKIVRLGRSQFEEEGMPVRELSKEITQICEFGLEYQTDEKLKFTNEFKRVEILEKTLQTLENKLTKNADKSSWNKVLQDLDAARRRLAWKRNECRGEVLSESDLVTGTLSSAGQRHFITFMLDYNIGFTSAIIDEACQTSEPSSLIPLRYGCKNLILAGDPRQLPATITCPAVRSTGFGQSLFERLEKLGHAKYLLTEQYRMHPKISSFPSKKWYNSLLKDHESIVDEVTMDARLRDPRLSRYCIFGPDDSLTLLAGITGFSSPAALRVEAINFFDIDSRESSASGKSKQNVSEALFCSFLAVQMKMSLPNRSIAILTPYSGQRVQVTTRLNQLAAQGNLVSGIEVNTVDGFQGREADVIIFSCVRTGTEGIGFLSDERRLNVAITRARGCLVIVGNSQLTRSKNAQNWKDLYDSISEQGRCIKVVPIV